MSIWNSVILASTVYSVIPSFWDRVLSKRVIRKIPNTKQIALTFDDGPDEKYTYQLLETLAEQDVKATFFVVGEKAAKNPSIVKMSQACGHEIGLHSYSHKCHWLMTPKATKKDFERSLKTLQDIGVNPKFFRPPWGLFNMFTGYYLKKYGLNAVYWSKHAFDWSKYVSVKDIRELLTNTIKGGDIVLLHDSSKANEAPLRTIQSVKQVITELKDKGLEFVTLRESVGYE
jgi:peptidoglycan-N-acetylglucosamine deacetylase